MIQERSAEAVGTGQMQDSERSRAARTLYSLPTYAGETYYGLPAIKSTHYRWTIVAYFFAGGLASAAQFIAAVIDLLGHKQDRLAVRAGRYIALAGALASPPLLIVDLFTPRRWYNMLRIYRRTSAMSIGSWALTAFGLFSGLAAAGQAAEDFFGWKLGRIMARIAGLPAALAGGVVAIYTGTLLASTSIPFWSSAYPFLSSLFASSAASSAVAAIELAVAPHASAGTLRRLNLLSLITGAVELLFAGLVSQEWRKDRADAPLQQGWLRLGWLAGVLGLGILGPLALHGSEAFLGHAKKPMSRPRITLGAAAMLLGGFLLRAVLVFGGGPSARRPRDYFFMTSPQKMVLSRNSPITARANNKP